MHVIFVFSSKEVRVISAIGGNAEQSEIGHVLGRQVRKTSELKVVPLIDP